MVYQELLYRIQVLETCQMLCKTAPVTTDTRELVGHYQLVDAVLFCAGKEHAFGAPVQEQGKAQAQGRRGEPGQDCGGLQEALFQLPGEKPGAVPAERFRHGRHGFGGLGPAAQHLRPHWRGGKAEMSKEEQYQKLCEINRVEGFDPAAFAVEYTDMNTGEVRKRLPVMIQMAWFRLKYPEGRIAVEVTPAKDCFVAKARVYPSYQGRPGVLPGGSHRLPGARPGPSLGFPQGVGPDRGRGRGPAQRGFRPTVQRSGGGFLPKLPGGTEPPKRPPPNRRNRPTKAEEPSPEEQLRQAMNTPCPIAKYKGKTLGDVLTLDPKAISWVANKFTGNSQISEAAKLLCDYALEQTAS